MALVGASNFDITGDAINIVEGDQTIHISQVIQSEKARTEYDEYRHIMRGDILRLEDFVSPEEGTWDLREGDWAYCEDGRYIYNAKIHGVRRSKFTVVSYHGPEAKQTWDADFSRYSREKRSNVFQLFAINRSEIPALIFYGDLVPIGTIFRGGYNSIYVGLYLESLATNQHCNPHELWLDERRGRLCQGPPGPPGGPQRLFAVKTPVGTVINHVPMTMDMLRESTVQRYFGHFGPKYDTTFLDYVDGQASDIGEYDDSLQSGLSGTIYSRIREVLATYVLPPSSSEERVPEWLSSWGLSEEKVMMKDGVARFSLNAPFRSDEWISLSCSSPFPKISIAWLSQALHVFHVLNIPPEAQEGCSLWAIETLYLESDNITDAESSKLDQQPVYLFLDPIPGTIFHSFDALQSWVYGDKDHYYWSLDESGSSRLTEIECLEMGLPVLEIYVDASFKWPVQVYKAIRNYQDARGFDPTSTDFAKHLGLSIFQVIKPVEADAGRFTEVDAGKITSEGDGMVSESTEERRQSDQATPQKLPIWLATEDICAVAI